MSDEKKAVIGRPKLEIDEVQLSALMRMTPTLADTAAFFECSEDTIENRIKEMGYETFSEFRSQKAVHTRLSAQRKAIEMALAGNVPMLIFYLKTHCGWSDKEGQVNVQINNQNAVVTASENEIKDRMKQLVEKHSTKKIDE